MKEKVYLFDTTLRDGQQTTGVNFSVSDKMIISQHLNDIGIDYIYHSDIYTLFFKDIDEIRYKHRTGILNDEYFC